MDVKFLDGHLRNLPSDKAVILDDGVSGDLESIEKKNKLGSDFVSYSAPSKGLCLTYPVVLKRRSTARTTLAWG